MATELSRCWRTDAIVAFARQGIAMETIARALAISADRVAIVCLSARCHGELQMLPPRSPDETRCTFLAELVHLRSQLDDTRALLRGMQEGAQAAFEPFVGVAGLTKREAKIVAVLAVKGSASKENIYDAVYGMHLGGKPPEPKIIDVFICKIRAKLCLHGIRIGTVWGAGYSMTAEHVAKLRALVPIARPQLEAAE